MQKIRNVISLFDGMSCLQIALIEQGIAFDNYYASEIDKHAIGQTQYNFPNTIQLGDITKWQDWDIDWAKVDLIGAGSPCQGFSFAGKQLAFDDHRSKLFFVFIEILNHVKKYNPNVNFVLENVDMKKDHLRIISEYCGLFPVNINSNLVSAQNRNRWYWSNIRVKKVGLFDELYTDIPQPKDEGILLRDILDKEVDEKYYIKSESVKALIKYNERQKENNRGFSAKFRDVETTDKMDCLKIGGGAKDDLLYVKVDKQLNPKPNQDKASCFTAGGNSGGNHSDMDLICVAMRGRNTENPSDRTKGIELEQRLEPNTTGKTNCLSTVLKDNLIMQINPSLESGGKQPYQQNIIYDENGITPALCANKSDLLVRQKNNLKETNEKANAFLSTSWKGSQANGMTLIEQQYRIRRLTPNECSKLQTIPSWYKWNCSDTQIYRMLGNGWTIKTIAWILSFM